MCRTPSVRCLLAVLLLTPVSAATAFTAEDLNVEARIERRGDFIALGFDAIWMMKRGALVRVDPVDNSVTEIAIDGARGEFRKMAIGEDGIWIPDAGTNLVSKFDPASHSVVFSIPVNLLGSSEGSIGVGEGSVWVPTIADGKSWVIRYDVATGAEQARIEIPLSDAVIVAFGSAWVSSLTKSKVYRIDAQSNSVIATIRTGPSPLFITSGFDSVWVLVKGQGVVQRIDPATNSVIATIETGGHQGGDIMVGGGFVWATYRDGLPLVQINPETNEAILYPGTGFGDAFAYGDGSIWISGRDIARVTPPAWPRQH